MAVHGDQGAAALGHLVVRAPGHPAGLHALRPGALGLGHAGRGEDPPFPPRVAVLPVPVGAGPRTSWGVPWGAARLASPVHTACRYVPVGLLERLPQRINERPPYYLGRDYLETLMASQKAADWIRIRCQESEALGCGRPRGAWAAGLTPPCAFFTVRCCWDLCRPTSSFCPSTRPMHTSSWGGGGAPDGPAGLLLHGTQ